MSLFYYPVSPVKLSLIKYCKIEKEKIQKPAYYTVMAHVQLLQIEKYIKRGLFANYILCVLFKHTLEIDLTKFHNLF